MNLLKIYRYTVRNRFFELECAKAYDAGKIKIPIYLSLGSEHIPPILNEIYPEAKVFAQHRCHSYYLSLGGKPEDLIYELTQGRQGSASLAHDRMFGHSGMLGDQVPIGVGYAHATNKPTIIVFGDAAAEEDYVLGAIGYAVTKKAKCLFICEDNNLSILTEKRVRRSWNIDDVAFAMGVDSYSTNKLITQHLTVLPGLINVNIDRYCWHAGSHVEIPEDDNIFQLTNYIIENGYDCLTLDCIKQEEKEYIEDVWQTTLK